MFAGKRVMACHYRRFFQAEEKPGDLEPVKNLAAA